jgi:ribonuclease-3 family protein
LKTNFGVFSLKRIKKAAGRLEVKDKKALGSCIPTIRIDEPSYSPLNKLQLFDYPISTLAWIGDAVYELEMRLALAKQTEAPAGSLNLRAIEMVSARGQSDLLEILLQEDDPARLNEAERTLLQRARNYHSKSISKGAEQADYRSATALEALLGAHMLAGNTERVAELIRSALQAMN